MRIPKFSEGTNIEDCYLVLSTTIFVYSARKIGYLGTCQAGTTFISKKVGFKDLQDRDVEFDL